MHNFENFDPIAASQNILPVLRETTAASEKARKVELAALKALTSSGLSRMLTPASRGGMELSPAAHIHSCRILAHGCSATSWIHMVYGAHTFVVGRFPQQAQEEVFKDNPDVLIPGTLASQGSAQKTADGWLVNGQWQFCSGIDHGDWVLIGTSGLAEDGEQSIKPVHLLVPKQDLQVLDTWHTLGIRGSGSHDLVADNVFVPEYRSMSTPTLFNGEFPNEVSQMHRLPVSTGLAMMVAACVLGIAERGYDAFVDATKVREDIYYGGSKAEKASIQARTAEAMGELECAALLLSQSCNMFDQALADNQPLMTLDQRVKIRWNASYITELSRRAIDRIFSIAGAHSIYNDSPLLTAFRDVNTSSHHAIVDFSGMAENRGKFELGLDRKVFGI